MKVYELASQMGVLSSEVTRLAMAHSMGHLGPADELTIEQEQALRGLLASGGTTAAEPMAWSPPPGPLDPHRADPLPTPPVPPPPPTNRDLSPWAPPAAGAFDHRGGLEPSAPPPPPLPPADPPGPPFDHGGGSAPAPELHRASRPETTASAPGAPTIDDPIPTGGTRDADRTQVFMVGGAVAVAVALFVYMALNMGGDPPGEAAVSATPPETTVSERSATTSTPVPSTSDAAAADTTTPVPAVPVEEPSPTTQIHRHEMRDAARYCAGARLTLPLEMRIGAAATEADWLGVQEAVREGRASWEQGVGDMLGGSSAALEDDVVAYRDSYQELFDAVLDAPSTTALLTVFHQYDFHAIQGSAGSINWAIQKHCS